MLFANYYYGVILYEVVYGKAKTNLYKFNEDHWQEFLKTE